MKRCHCGHGKSFHFFGPRWKGRCGMDGCKCQGFHQEDSMSENDAPKDETKTDGEPASSQADGAGDAPTEKTEEATTE